MNTTDHENHDPFPSCSDPDYPRYSYRRHELVYLPG
jgi:hypothetical protein